MSQSGTVIVRGNRYHPQGDFHRIDRNTPIRDADRGWRLLGVTNPRDMVYIHSYGGEAPFFEGLGQGKLLATSFHPELTGDDRFHRYFLTLAEAASP